MMTTIAQYINAKGHSGREGKASPGESGSDVLVKTEKPTRMGRLFQSLLATRNEKRKVVSDLKIKPKSSTVLIRINDADSSVLIGINNTYSSILIGVNNPDAGERDSCCH